MGACMSLESSVYDPCRFLFPLPGVKRSYMCRMFYVRFLHPALSGMVYMRSRRTFFCFKSSCSRLQRAEAVAQAAVGQSYREGFHLVESKQAKQRAQGLALLTRFHLPLAGCE